MLTHFGVYARNAVALEEELLADRVVDGNRSDLVGARGCIGVP